MTNGSVVQTAGSVKILLKCGAYHGVVEARVFPGLDKPMILGIRVAQKRKPHIDWTRSTVVVQQKNQWISLPLVQKTNPSAYSVNEISANEAQTMSPSTREMQEAFLGLVRCVNEESVIMEVQGESIQNSSPKWLEDLLDSIRAVQEYDDIFPQDLPRGLPPMRKGHEFRDQIGG